jgi:hypothetical protein
MSAAAAPTASAPPAVPEAAPGAAGAAGSIGTGLPLTLPLRCAGAAQALAAFALLLSGYRGEDAVEVLVRTAGGELPLRLDPSANPSALRFTADVA